MNKTYKDYIQQVTDNVIANDPRMKKLKKRHTKQAINFMLRNITQEITRNSIIRIHEYLQIYPSIKQ